MIRFFSDTGTGLFFGTGAAYANAGPAGLLLAYIIVGSVSWWVTQSVTELAIIVRKTSHLRLKTMLTYIRIPTGGSFPHFATRFIESTVGFFSVKNVFTDTLTSKLSNVPGLHLDKVAITQMGAMSIK